MTYQEALKARARLAYSATGLVKSAAPKTQDELVTESLMLQDAAGRKTKEKGAELQSKADDQIGNLRDTLAVASEEKPDVQA